MFVPSVPDAFCRKCASLQKIFLSLFLTVLKLATVCAGSRLQYLGFQHWKVNRLYKSVVTGNVKFKRAVEEILRQP